MIRNGEICISKDKWQDLNSTYSKDEIKLQISNAIDNCNISMPMRTISMNEAEEEYVSLLELTREDTMVESSWFSRYDYDDKFYSKDIVIRSNTIGNKSSDVFMQETRWMCDSINAPSPYRSWNIEKFRLTLLNALWSLKVKEVNTATLRSCIGLRKYIASQFRPSAAKTIYDLFDAKNVLDFSSGWGDRLVGFMASSGESYVGIDPNERLFANYNKMVNKYNVYQQDIELHNGCAEDIELDRRFDLIFTSPPYFNVERYTQESNQSFKKFRKLDDWLEGFLLKTIRKFWENLEVGGHLVINISDVYSNHRVNKICDPMNEAISKLNGASYCGCIGYEMRKRPNSGALKGKEGVFAEPIWIWRKTK